MAVPLYKCVRLASLMLGQKFTISYSAELAPPEVRGSLVALQQLAITFGIMISFWIDYGTNYIGGTGEGQTQAAWRIPIALQLVPAIILGIGILFMPFSPRLGLLFARIFRLTLMPNDAGGWSTRVAMTKRLLCSAGLVVWRRILMSSRSSSCTYSRTAGQILSLTFRVSEIKAQHMFEVETSKVNFPQYQDGSFASNFKLGLFAYMSLLTTRSECNTMTVGLT